MGDEVRKITVEQLKERVVSGERTTIVDARRRGTYDLSDVKIEGAVDIPLAEIESRAGELPEDQPIVLYCT